MITVLNKGNNGIDLISLKNEKLEVVVTNYGCTIVKVLMADKDGNVSDVVLGYEDLETYGKVDAYLGALVGRIANRIKKGHFELNGEEYNLAINNGPNHLHGGIKGFSYQIFDYEIKDDKTIVFSYLSKDMEEGYPGNLDFKAYYTLEDDTLIIRYTATTDKDTIINITNHSYFNLSGKSKYIGDHKLIMKADKFACIDGDGLPTGAFRDVEGSAFDFREAAYLADRLAMEDEQLTLGNGFDHPFIFNTDKDQAVLIHEESGRKLTVSTTLPGAQVYTANYLDGRAGKYGETYDARDAVCIETSNLPDAIHLEENPSTILRKGEEFDETTSYKFEVIK